MIVSDLLSIIEPYDTATEYEAGAMARYNLGGWHIFRVKSTVTDPSAVIRDAPNFSFNSQWETPYTVTVGWVNSTNYLAGDPRIIQVYDATGKLYKQYKRTNTALTGAAPFISPEADTAKTYYEPIGATSTGNTSDNTTIHKDLYFVKSDLVNGVLTLPDIAVSVFEVRFDNYDLDPKNSQASSIADSDYTITYPSNQITFDAATVTAMSGTGRGYVGYYTNVNITASADFAAYLRSLPGYTDPTKTFLRKDTDGSFYWGSNGGVTQDPAPAAPSLAIDDSGNTATTTMLSNFLSLADYEYNFIAT